MTVLTSCRSLFEMSSLLRISKLMTNFNTGYEIKDD
uniref:Uncharacterized protein n=1 Tax=Arundo donax TaxID=35708 RepID=A0A0A9CII3_ARUDO